MEKTTILTTEKIMVNLRLNSKMKFLLIYQIQKLSIRKFQKNPKYNQGIYLYGSIQRDIISYMQSLLNEIIPIEN
jgi:hypothetical protein